MQLALEKGEMHIEYYSETLTTGAQLRVEVGVEMMILKWILKTQCVRTRTG
jgi:hypothetical protein